METNEVIVDNEEYQDFVQDNQENISSSEIPVLDEIDLHTPAFIGFGIASAMCLISITIASVMRIFRKAS